jgi:exopolyphosphatase/guanosine-5'-triphosphate,3'-diphosphate pyrophosphatase
MLEQIIASSQAERDQNPHIIAIRKRMAPIAAVKTRWVMNQLSIKHIFISPYSLKEGALITQV